MKADHITISDGMPMFQFAFLPLSKHGRLSPAGRCSVFYFPTFAGKVILAHMDLTTGIERIVVSRALLHEIARVTYGVAFKPEGVRFTYVEQVGDRFEAVIHRFVNGEPIISDYLPVAPIREGEAGYDLDAFHALLNSPTA